MHSASIPPESLDFKLTLTCRMAAVVRIQRGETDIMHATTSNRTSPIHSPASASPSPAAPPDSASPWCATCSTAARTSPSSRGTATRSRASPRSTTAPTASPATSRARTTSTRSPCRSWARSAGSTSSSTMRRISGPVPLALLGRHRVRGLRPRPRHQRARPVPADQGAARRAGRIGPRGLRRAWC